MITGRVGAAIAEWGPIMLLACLIVVFRAGDDAGVANAAVDVSPGAAQTSGSTGAAPSTAGTTPSATSGLALPPLTLPSSDKLIEELDYLVQNYGIRNIKIIDELFALKEDRVVEICDLIIERGYDLNMWAYARVNTVTPGMLSKMKEAGINRAFIGNIGLDNVPADAELTTREIDVIALEH